MIGPSSHSNACSLMRAAISPATPPVRVSSWAISTLLVLRTVGTMAASSDGSSVGTLGNGAAAGTPHHEGGGEPRAVAGGGDVVGQHVVGAGDEVDELHLGHGRQAHVGGARGGAYDRRLGNGGVDHPRLAEALDEPLGDLEGPTVESHVLAQAEDARIALHLVPQPSPQRLEISHLGH